jgi:Helix-turn-helix
LHPASYVSTVSTEAPQNQILAPGGVGRPAHRDFGTDGPRWAAWRALAGWAVVTVTYGLLKHPALAHRPACAEVSRSYLSQLEKGAFYASLKIVDKLAKVLDVEPAELLRSPKTRKKSDR